MNIQEAAKEYADGQYEPTDRGILYRETQDDFTAGAEWHAKQSIEILSSVLENWVHGGDADCIIAEFEELFLAIAALRDDTDENQWFTNGEEWAYHPKTECCSPCNTVYRTLAFDSIPKDTNMGNYHKATVEELIEHFKEKEVNHG